MSCSILPTFTGPPSKPKGLWVLPEDGYKDYRGVIHCHSEYSHDSPGKKEDIIKAAKKVGIDFLIMTDHPSPKALPEGLKGWHKGILFLVGAELSQGKWGMLALDIQQYPNHHQPTQHLIKAIKEQGGLAFVGHMERVMHWSFSGYDGLEIYNLHADLMDENMLLMALKAFFAPPNYFFSSSIDGPGRNLTKWDKLTQLQPVVGIAGNDAHANVKLFFGLAGTLGTYEQMFKIVSTHILAKTLNKDTLKEALLRGHCYISLDIFGDGTGFTFLAKSRQRQVIMGDEIPWNEDLEFLVYIPAEGVLKLIKDGNVIVQKRGQFLNYKVSHSGIYRIEAYRKGRPWIFSNPIYVR